MMNSSTQNSFSSRPGSHSKLSRNELKEQLELESEKQKYNNQKERTQAIHSKIIGLINDLPTIICRLAIGLLCFDIWICVFYWKKPELLFEQLRSITFFIISFILGVVAEYIRKKIINQNISQ